MKKTLNFILCIALAACLFPVSVCGQAKITTKKAKLGDFTTKTTKVVLAGSEMFNNALQEEVTSRWMASPYEFCTQQEYEASCKNPDYYFLIPVTSKLKKETEPGIVVLSLIKGGDEEAASPDKQGFEVVSIPCAAADAPSGREYVFLPALLDIIQRYVTDAMASDMVGYGGLGSYTSKMLKNRDKKIVFSSDDLAPSVSMTDEWLSKNMEAMEEDDADQIFADNAPNTIVSYVVAPAEPSKGAVCYKMLISADTHELCYFEKHQIKGGNGAGFLPFDVKFIAAARKKL